MQTAIVEAAVAAPSQQVALATERGKWTAEVVGKGACNNMAKRSLNPQMAQGASSYHLSEEEAASSSLRMALEEAARIQQKSGKTFRGKLEGKFWKNMRKCRRSREDRETENTNGNMEKKNRKKQQAQTIKHI